MGLWWCLRSRWRGQCGNICRKTACSSLFYQHFAFPWAPFWRWCDFLCDACILLAFLLFSPPQWYSGACLLHSNNSCNIFNSYPLPASLSLLWIPQGTRCIMHFPARNQTSPGSALSKKKTKKSSFLSGSPALWELAECAEAHRGGFPSLFGCEVQGMELHQLLQTKRLPHTQISAQTVGPPWWDISSCPQPSQHWGVELQGWSWLMGGRFWYQK